MSRHGFGRTDCQFIGVFSEHVLDGQRFHPVAKRGRGAVCVDVAHLLRQNISVRQCILHHAGSPFAILRRGGDVEGVRGHSVPDHFGEDWRSAADRKPQLLQDQDA